MSGIPQRSRPQEVGGLSWTSTATADIALLYRLA
jgi:hypothetical protein